MANTTVIFCQVRKKWVKRTPEEEVRQAVIYHMFHHLGYPLSLMAVEYSMVVNNRPVRCDIVVFDNQLHQPLLVVECKASHIKLDEAVKDQVIRYNMELKVKHILMTNGHTHIFYSWSNETHSLISLHSIPEYKVLANS